MIAAVVVLLLISALLGVIAWLLVTDWHGAERLEQEVSRLKVERCALRAALAQAEARIPDDVLDELDEEIARLLGDA